MTLTLAVKLGVTSAILGVLAACSPVNTQPQLPTPPKRVDNAGAQVEPAPQTDVLISQSGAKIKPLIEPVVVREQKSQKKSQVSGAWYKSNQARAESMPVAAKTLVHDASRAIDSKDYAQAERLLARAQRMAPKAAPVYYETARLSLAKKAYTKAEKLLEKGISVAAGRKEVLKDLWTLLAEARDGSGDLMGAQRARLKARRYR